MAININSLFPVNAVAIFKVTSMVDIFSISCEIAVSWMQQDLTGV